MNTTNRRDFLQRAAIGSLGLSAIPSILSAASGSKKGSKKITLTQASTILFQGDSITDAGRDKSAVNPNQQNMLGAGYALFAAAELLHAKAALDLKIYNKGISGNKVYQLAERWQADCLDIRPDVLSILIGVNDFWHKLNWKYEGTVEIYENDYRSLLKKTKEALPNVQLVIGEPFAVLETSAVNEKWFPEFDAYRAVSQKLATEFEAIFIPYHTIFTEASKIAPAVYWTGDGVHPSVAGAQLMAAAWLDAVIGSQK